MNLFLSAAVDQNLIQLTGLRTVALEIGLEVHAPRADLGAKACCVSKRNQSWPGQKPSSQTSPSPLQPCQTVFRPIHSTTKCGDSRTARRDSRSRSKKNAKRAMSNGLPAAPITSASSHASETGLMTRTA